MPALVANHQKKVVTTKLKKFYTVLQNARSMRFAETADAKPNYSMVTANNNPDMLLEFWDVNYAPYIKTAGAPQKTQRGIIVPLSDGGGVYLQATANGGSPPSSGSNPGAHLILVYCVNYKECPLQELSLDSNRVSVDGKSRFRFHTNTNTEVDFYYVQTREAALAACKGETQTYLPRYFCTELIMHDNWEIKDDYPW